MERKDNLIPEDDYEYEKELARREHEQQIAAEQEALKRAERQKQAEKAREKRIQQDKIELMKLKSGVIEQSETMKEEHDQIRELHGIEKLKNIWYHFKWIILFVIFLIAVCTYIIINTASRTTPDLTVLMVADNGLQYRQEELETFFEKYAEDTNGDGDTKVSVIIAPLDSTSNDQMFISNQSKVMGTIQAGDCLMFITDSNTDDTIKSILKSDLSDDFPGNKYINEQGLSLNMKLFAREVKFENLPNDVVLSIMQPTETISVSEKDMKEKYKANFKVFKKIADDLTSKAESTNDPGLKNKPVKKNADNSSATK